MHSAPATAKRILKEASIDAIPSLSVFGYRYPLISIYSQQIRALNLVWALFATGRLKPQQRLVVVGAGIGGITTAIAAASKGADVVVYDHAPAYLGNLRVASHRYLHPRMAYWPDEDWDDPVADVPVLPWHAMYGDHLWAWFSRQIEHYRERYKVRSADHGTLTIALAKGIQSVHRDGGGYVVRVERRRSLEPFDHLVLALGPGHERREYGSRRYWDNDQMAFDRRVGARTVHISGTGDGGLIDVLRHALFDPDRQDRISHRDLIEFLHRMPLDAEPRLRERIRRAMQPRVRPYAYWSAIENLADTFPMLLGSAPDQDRDAVTLIAAGGHSALRKAYRAAPLHQALAIALTQERFPGRRAPVILERRRLPGYQWNAEECQWHRADGAAVAHEIVTRHGTRPPIIAFLDRTDLTQAERKALLAVCAPEIPKPTSLRVTAYYGAFFEHHDRLPRSWNHSEWPTALGDLWLAMNTALGSRKPEAPKEDDDLDIDRILRQPARLSWLTSDLGERAHPKPARLAARAGLVREALQRVGRRVAEVRAYTADAAAPAALLEYWEACEARGTIVLYHDVNVLPATPAAPYEPPTARLQAFRVVARTLEGPCMVQLAKSGAAVEAAVLACANQDKGPLKELVLRLTPQGDRLRLCEVLGRRTLWSHDLLPGQAVLTDVYAFEGSANSNIARFVRLLWRVHNGRAPSPREVGTLDADVVAHVGIDGTTVEFTRLGTNIQGESARCAMRDAVRSNTQ